MKRIHSIALVALGSAVCASPAMAQDYANLSGSLFGDYISAGGADDAEGDFNGEADLTRGRLCYYLEIEGVDDANSAAIHHGAAREDGPEVLALTLPGDGGDEVCLTVDAALLRTISGEPDNYYLIVRSPAHPDGAIRGQLSD